jgi:hypothetical protein
MLSASSSLGMPGQGQPQLGAVAAAHQRHGGRVVSPVNTAARVAGAVFGGVSASASNSAARPGSAIF